MGFTMHKLAHTCLLGALIWSTAISCAPPAELEIARLSLQLAQSAAVDFVDVRATQAGSTVRGEATADGEVTLAVRAGVETRLSVAVFDTAPQLWRDFEGTHIFVPQPGENEVEIDAKEVALRRGTILPSLVGPLGAAVPWRKAQPLLVADKLTGFADATSFAAALPLALPEGRTFTITLERPDSGEAFSFDLAVRGDFGEFNIPAGLAPELPPPLAISSASGIVDVATALGASPDFPLVCAVGPACADTLDWVACDPLNLQTLIVGEGRVDVWVRYEDLPDLGCSRVEVTVDTTAPAASLAFDPPVLDSNAPPASVRARILASELLEPSSLSLVATDALDATYSCAAFTAIPVPGSAVPAYECLLDTSTWTAAAGDLTVVASGSDRAGNPMGVPASATLRHLPLNVGSALKIVGLRTFPEQPSVRGRGFLVGIDVINTGPTWLCRLNAWSINFPDDPSSFFSYGGGSPQLSRLAPSDAADIHVGTLWSPVEIYPMTPLAPGRVTVEVQVSAESHTGRGCDDDTPAGVQSDLETLSVELTLPPLGWVNDGPLGLSFTPWDQGSAARGIWPPLAGGSSPLDLAYEVAISDPVVTLETGEGSTLVGLAPGSATVTFTDPADDTSAATAVEVSPPPELLLLHNSRLTRLSPTSSETLVIDPAIHPEIIGGQGIAPPPFKVLWESSRDLILAIGYRGVQRLPASPVSSVIAPCGAVTVIDATLTAEDPATGQPPGLVLLTEGPVGTFKHCAVALDDWGQTQAVVLGPTATCGLPERLQADLLTDRFLLVGRTDAAGPVCAAQYRTDGVALTDLVRQTGSARSPLLAAAFDPYGNFLAVGSSPNVLSGWQAGFALAPTAELDLAGGSPALELYDLVVDPSSGAILAATLSDLAGLGIGARLHRFDNRVSALGLVQRSSVWAGRSLTRLALDAGHRVLYAVDNQSPPSVWPVAADGLAGWNPGWGPAIQLPTDEQVADAIVAGPQLVGVEPRLARPGSVVVARGLGFAGQGRDQVFVDGLPAEVLASTTTRVTFRVPAGLARLSDPLSSNPVTPARVTVRSHGRMSGPGPYETFAVRAEVPNQLLSLLSSFGYMECGSQCDTPALFDGPGGFFAARSTGAQPDIERLNSGGGMSWGITGGAGLVPSHLALVNGGQRLLGVRGSEWAELDLVDDGSSFEPVRLGGAAPSGVTAMAGDPSGTLAAVGLGTRVRIYSSTSQRLLRDDLPSGTVSPRQLAFMPDGAAVVAAASGGAIDVFPLAGPAAVHSPTRVGSCPSGTVRLLGLWPRSVPQSEVVAVLAGASGADLAVATIRADATGGYAYTCESIVMLADGAPLVAALSLLGDALAVVVDAGASPRLLLLDAFDLTRELDVALDATWSTLPQSAHVGVGDALWQAPALVVMNPGEPWFWTLKPMRGD